MSKYALVESEEELLRIFRQCGGRLMIKRDCISIASNGKLDHEAVMRKQDLLHCTDHFQSLTKEQRDDHGLMMRFIRIFASKWSAAIREMDEDEDEDEDEAISSDAKKSYLISNHPMRFASKRLVCNEAFVTEVMWNGNMNFSNLSLVFKHSIPWWVKRKMWYVVCMNRVFHANHVDEMVGPMEGTMEKMGVFKDPKVAIHALSFDLGLVSLISEHCPSMFLDQWFWKEVFFKNTLGPYHIRKFLKYHVPSTIKRDKQSFLSLVCSCNTWNKNGIMNHEFISECGLYDWTNDDDFLSMV